MSEQATDDAAFFAAKTKRCDQIGHDVVVIARVERDVIAARFDHRAHDIQRLVAVEWRDLDGHDVLDFRKATPESKWQHTSADARLQIEADHRNGLRNRPAVRDEFILRSLPHCAET